MGAYGFNVSGGGSSVFAVCPLEKQQEIAQMMQDTFAENEYFVKVICTHTSNRGVCEKCE
jgi:homoserine kinase